MNIIIRTGGESDATAVFVVGTDPQTDRILVRQITTPPIANGAT